MAGPAQVPAHALDATTGPLGRGNCAPGRTEGESVL